MVLYILLLLPLVLAANFDFNIWREIMSCDSSVRESLACTCRELRDFSHEFWKQGLHLEGLRNFPDYHPDLEVYSNFDLTKSQNSRDLTTILLLSTVRRVVHEADLAEKIHALAIQGLLSHPDPLAILKLVPDNEYAINQFINMKLGAGESDTATNLITKIRELYPNLSLSFYMLTPPLQKYILEDPKRILLLFPYPSVDFIEFLFTLKCTKTQFKEILQEYYEKAAEAFMDGLQSMLNSGKVSSFDGPLVKKRIKWFTQIFTSDDNSDQYIDLVDVLILRGLIRVPFKPFYNVKTLAHALIGGNISYFYKYFLPENADLIIERLSGSTRQAFIAKILADPKLESIYASKSKLVFENRELFYARFGKTVLQYFQQNLNLFMPESIVNLLSEGSDEEIAAFFQKAPKKYFQSFFDILNRTDNARTPAKYIQTLRIFVQNRRWSLFDDTFASEKSFVRFEIKRMDCFKALMEEEELVLALPNRWFRIYIADEIFDQVLAFNGRIRGISYQRSNTKQLHKAFLSRLAIKRYISLRFEDDSQTDFKELFEKSLNNVLDMINSDPNNYLLAIVKLLPMLQFSLFESDLPNSKEIEQFFAKMPPEVQAIFQSINSSNDFKSLQALLCEHNN